MTSKVKGELTEAKLLVSFLEKGWIVSKPHGDSSPYDMILDTGLQLQKIQCKTARKTDNPGAFEFSTKSIRINTKGTYITSYEGKIDAFAVYFPDLNKSYLIPYSTIAHLKGKKAIVRYEECLNKQTSSALKADEYAL